MTIDNQPLNFEPDCCC